MTKATELLAGLPVDDGRWGDTAADFQLADAAAVFGATGPRFHYLTRPRGGRKTADAAGMAIALHLTEAPLGATSYVVASDAGQAGLVLDTVRGFLLRDRSLRKLVKLESRRIVFVRDGERQSSIEVLPSDEASSYGLRPWLLIADELAVWPETPSAKGVWAAVVSAMGKVEGAKLVVLTSAGAPTHWSHAVLEQAKASPAWRVSETPGPLPWASHEMLAVQRSLLTASMYARLHENRWVTGEDRLTTPEQVRACVGHSGSVAPRRGVRYCHGLDVGLVSDRTVFTSAHAELREGAVTVVVDHQETWQGSKARPVDLGEVEEFIRGAVAKYPGRVITDPWQSVHLSQRLRSHGIRVEEFVFSSASVGRLALTLYRLLRDQLLDLPDDAELVNELASVVLRETQPGTYRIDTTGQGHDDRVISLALVAQDLLSRVSGWATIHVPTGRLPTVKVIRSDTPTDPGALVVRSDEPVVRGATRRPGGGLNIPRSHRGYSPPRSR